MKFLIYPLKIKKQLHSDFKKKAKQEGVTMRSIIIKAIEKFTYKK